MATLKNGDRIPVKQLKNGDVVEINFHDYFYKGLDDIIIKGGRVRQIVFWSTKTDFKKFFNLELLEFLVEWNETAKKFIWVGKKK